MAVYQDKARDRIRKGLTRFKTIAQRARDKSDNEANTRLIITSILDELLGWCKFEDVTGEHCIKGTYADFAIKHGDTIFALIEVKSICIALNPKHLHQALNYAANEGVDWVLLTNGADWHLYRVIFGKPISQDLVFQVSLLDDQQKPRDSVGLLYLLSREAQRKNELEAYYQKKAALSGANIAKALLKESVLKRIRAEMRNMTDHSVSLEELATILVSDVIRPDAQDTQTLRLLRKATSATKHSRKVPVQN